MTNDSMEQKWQNSWLSVGHDYLEELYEQYQLDPDHLEASIKNTFSKFANKDDELHSKVKDQFRNSLLRPSRAYVGASSSNIGNEKQAGVHELINGYRLLGHLYSDMDPLDLREKLIVPELELVYFGLSKQDLKTEYNAGSLAGSKSRSLETILSDLRKIYCSKATAEFMHIPDSGERFWLQERYENTMLNMKLSVEEKTHVLEKLVAAEGLEQYLASNYPGAKRFGLEGCESLIVSIDTLVNHGGLNGLEEVVIGMAHRGRLNVLVNILGKAPAELFDEFEGKFNNDLESGDVKYHQGFSSDVKTPGGYMHLSLAFNPSHLEIVNPVVCGSTRARQERRKAEGFAKVMPIAIHGDSAISGQGIVMETMNMAKTRGYSNGGTVHIIVNNQIGFTTSNPHDMRSTLYSSDIGKMMQIPVFHVNAEDPESVYEISKIAIEYRNRFRKDVIIDLVGYRRYGHNEADEPSATQPLMYQRIKKKQPIRKIYAENLSQEGSVDSSTINKLASEYRDMLDAREAIVAKNIVKEGWHSEYATDWSAFTVKDWRYPVKTSIADDELSSLMERISTVPDDIKPHSRVKKIYEDRHKMASREKPMDWGFAETLAYASLLSEGTPVRISGQDSGRGTFFHRHAVIHDQNSGKAYIPLSNLSQSQGNFTVIDSTLSEAGVLGFEYGYAASEPKALVIWEAQFGDFANGAQVVIDQFISSGEQKWGRYCGLCLFLPHGYEGQGPEHSSARLERYLQLCAQHNMQVCVPSTPAQVFHMLRRQILRPMRKPLVVMTPKSLLRHKEAVSSPDLLLNGSFQTVIPDEQDKSKVTRVVLCSGKVFYDLKLRAEEENLTNVAILRIEQLYPFPKDELKAQLEMYTEAKDVIWCQEEPKNQGAWYCTNHNFISSLADWQKLSFSGRAASAAPAVGYAQLHKEQQDSLVNDALGIKVS